MEAACSFELVQLTRGTRLFCVACTLPFAVEVSFRAVAGSEKIDGKRFSMLSRIVPHATPVNAARFVSLSYYCRTHVLGPTLEVAVEILMRANGQKPDQPCWHFQSVGYQIF